MHSDSPPRNVKISKSDIAIQRKCFMHNTEGCKNQTLVIADLKDALLSDSSLLKR